MICKIQPPNPNMEATVKYNEKKANGIEGPRTGDYDVKDIEDGYILATRNLEDGKSLIQEFNERRITNLKTRRSGPRIKEQTFHMSVNPSDTDKPLSDNEAIEYIDELMSGLGYSEQPYRIYKHKDIERVHYHVVSCRIDKNGKKVKDNFERLVLRDLMKKLAKKYGYTVILSEEEKREQNELNSEENLAIPEAKSATTKKEIKEDTETKRSFVPPYNKKSATPMTQQLREANEDALKWHFSTFEQYQALLLRRYNVLVEIEKSEDNLVFSGTDSNGKIVTPLLHENEIGIDVLRQVREKISKEKMRNRKEQRERLEKLARATAKIATSFDDFKKLIEKKGVIVVLSFNKDNEVFGVTYLDKATKCAWKGSETTVDLNWLKETAKEKGWTLTKDAQQKNLEKVQNRPSRKKDLKNEKEPQTEKHTGTSGSEGHTRIPKIHSDDRPIQTGNKTTGSNDSVLYRPEEKRKDIDDDKPVELVH